MVNSLAGVDKNNNNAPQVKNVEGVKPILITINGVAYNVAAWLDSHPGGPVMAKWEGKDATDVFISLHEPATFAMLDRYKYKAQDKSTVADPSPKAAAFNAFRKQIEAMGYFKTNPLWNFYKTFTTLGFIVMGAVLAVVFDQPILGALSMGIGFQQIGWLGHDYSHHQVFNSRYLNRLGGYLTGNIFQGFSQRWWDDRHNSHHAITNVLDSDPDVDNLPLFCWSVHDLYRVPESVKSWIRYQQYYFVFPFTPLLRLIWLFQSIMFVIGLPTHKNGVYRSYATPERVTLFIHWAWYLTVLAMTNNKIWFFVISQCLPGFGIAIVVFFNHYACHHYQNAQQQFDFVDLICNTTRDMTAPALLTPLVDWICGGLNLQIEHHMFPTMPRHNLRAVVPLVEKFCKENNVPYQTAGFFEGVGYLHKQLAEVSSQLEKMKQI